MAKPTFTASRPNPLESQIRTALVKELALHLPALGGGLAVPEFVVCNYASRVDLAVFHQSGSHAFEIKCDGDTLVRLSRQMKFAGQVFEFLWAVVAERHLAGALAIVPAHAGVLVTTGGADAIRFEMQREAVLNPARTGDTFIHYLWRAELQQLIEAHGQLGWCSALNRKNKEYLVQLILSCYQPQALRAEAVRLMAARTNWRTAGHSLAISIIPGGKTGIPARTPV